VKMKTIRLLLGVLTTALLISGCATPASQNHVPFKVTSDPVGCPVEVNGIYSGDTPTTIKLGLSKHWVGLMYSSDGWGYGNEVYNITCLPPTETAELLTSQTKVIAPSMTPKGADIHFNLRLRHVTPTQTIDINQRGKSEVIIKDDSDKKVDDSAYEKMEELKKMKDAGLITEDEYNSEKKEILEDF
jgi:hypothetical protein